MAANFYNTEVLELFLRSSKKFFFDRAPMFYDVLNECDILFVGINPSFIELSKSYQFIKKNCLKDDQISYISRLSETEYKNIFLELDNVSQNIKILGDIHSVFKNNYGYFNKFKSISKQLNLCIEHLDLFPIRETSQSKVSKIINQNIDFKNDCLKLFIGNIKKINPKAIVVENTVVRDLLINHNDKEINEYFPSYEIDYFKDNDIGTPVNKYGVAIYYTSMLTGQRAIDLGSFHRLMWSLNKFFYKN
jgi:hypothetical protein